MEFVLNGKTVSAEPAEDTSLLELLRTELGVRSVKDGCAPEGSCGACTVIVEGRAVVSCAQKATRFEGKHVTTHEGLSEEERRRWSESFVAAGASQCGYCSPGIVMKAEVLLHKHPEPTREEVAHALLGNLCRCTGYVKVIDAIQLAAAARRGEPLPEPDRSGRVGSRTARYQGTELALGDNVFVGDMDVPGMLHGALRFSDHPRARILRHRRLEGARGAGRGGRPHGRRRARRARAGLDQARLAPARGGGRGHRVRRRRDRRRRGGDAPRGPRGGGARRGRVRGARAGDGPVRSPGRRGARAARGRQRAVGLEGAARRRRRRPRGGGARGDGVLPHPGHRARLPRARVLAGRARRGRPARGLLPGPGRLGRPPPDRVVPGASGGARARHARADGRRLRRQGGPQRPEPRCSARDADGASRAPDADPQGEPPLPLEAPPDVARLHRRLRRGRQAARDPGAHRRRHRRLRERRRQGDRAGGRSCLRRLRGRQRRHRGRSGLYQ